MKKLKSDKYSRSRGGNSKLIKIICSSCNKELLNYQKDGIGNLRRLYVDRIHENFNSKDLRCKNCKNLIGVLIVYKKENRPAYRLVSGTFIKKNAI